MVANIGFNPYTTTTALGGFSVSSDGYIQGTMLDDPSSRNYLAGGVLSQNETIPMWGGVAIYEDIPLNNNTAPLGPVVGRSTTVATIQGFSLFNQAIHWLTTPSSQCPSVGSGGTVPFVRLGSVNRVALQIDPALVSLNGGLTTQQVSWDFVNQRLIPYYPAETGETITGMTWASGIVTVTTSAAHGFVAGNDVTITGTVPTAYNGSYSIISAPTTTTFTYALPNGGISPGSVTTQGAISAGGGALPVRILETQIGNSKTVVYDPINNVVNFNPFGSVAIVLV